MTDNAELKRLAYEATESGIEWLDAAQWSALLSEDWADFVAAANPEAVLGLLEDNERLRQAVGTQAVRSLVGSLDQQAIDSLLAAGIRADQQLIAQLQAEVARLRGALRQIFNEVDGNIRSTVRDLVNRVSGLNNGADPNDLYYYCARIETIIDDIDESIGEEAADAGKPQG